jgi:3-dehydroquinate synthase
MRVLLARPGSLSDSRWARGLSLDGKIALVSTPRVFSLYGKKAVSALKKAGLSVFVFLLPEGEGSKSWDRAGKLLRDMAQVRLTRRSAVAALGGGALTDVAGFAASVFMRGIAWACLPTTMLGQLDAGLGGKTAVNIKEGKNLVGAFHEPAVIVCDPLVLKTLPDRERRSGLAEAVKTALLFDVGLWNLIQRRWVGLILGEPGITGQVVKACAAWKLKIVAQDPHEKKGLREFLNFGHTLGHALEKEAGYGEILHGEAVAWGLRAALRLSPLLRREVEKIDPFLISLQGKIPPRIAAQKILEAAHYDKKARDGRLRFVLLRKIGKPFVSDSVSDSSARAVVNQLLK